MTVQLAPPIVFQSFLPTGSPNAFGTVATYIAGTTTAQATWIDATQTTQNQNPTPLNALGQASIWLGTNLVYKIITFDALGNQINFQDQIAGGVFATPIGASIIPTPDNTLTLGNTTNSWANVYVGDDHAPIFDPVSGNVGYYDQTAAEIVAGVIPTNFSYTPGDVRRYGAKGDGVTDDSNSLETAANSGEKFIVYKSGLNFKITRALNFHTSGVTHLMRGATITQATTNTTAILLGYNGTAFVKTDNTTFEGGKFAGADNGLTSTYSVGISIFPPTNNPYTSGAGCSHTKIIDTWIDNFCIAVAATGADDVLIDGMLGTNMQYHLSLSAGGYGVLMQTCFAIKVTERCRFVGGSNSRHAIYISSDPGRTFDANNVCYDVNIGACMIDWTAVTGVTGFECGIVIRSAFDISVIGTSIKGAFGGVQYDNQNATGASNVIISNVNVASMQVGSSQIAGIWFNRSGTNRTNNVVVTNCTVQLPNNANGVGVQLVCCDGIVSGGHNVSCPSGSYLYGIYTVDCTDQVHMSSRISGNKTTGMQWAQVSTANNNVQVDRPQISGPGTNFAYSTVPTSLRFTYARSFQVSWSAGTPTITNDDYAVAASAVSDPNGFTVTVNNEITAVAQNFSLTSQSSGVGSVYVRSIAGQVITVGVNTSGGVAMPANVNNYVVTIVVLH